MATNTVSRNLTKDVHNAIAQDGGYAVYSHYGYDCTSKRKIRSPFREDRNASFSFNQKGGKYFWRDWGRDGERGDAIAFAMKLCRIGYADAIRDIAGIYGLGTGTKPKARPQAPQSSHKPKEPETVTVPTLEWLGLMANHASPFHEASRALGITTEHLAKWHVGTDKRGNTVFGLRNEAGQFCRYKYDLYKANGKRVKQWPNGKDRHAYHAKPLDANGKEDKSKRYDTPPYGLHLLDRSKETILVEAEKTALWGSFWLPEYNWIATGGANRIGNTPNLLEGTFGLVLFDADQAGRDGASKFAGMLNGLQSTQYRPLDLWPEYGQADECPNKGRDLADAIQDGATPDQLRELIAKAKELPTTGQKSTERPHNGRTVHIRRYVSEKLKPLSERLKTCKMVALTAPTGTGKTKAAMKVARELMEAANDLMKAGEIDRVVYVAPTIALARQNATMFNTAAVNPFDYALGFEVLDGTADADLRRGFDKLPWIATTFATYANYAHKADCERTLVIMDEWHECITKPFDANTEILGIAQRTKATVLLLSGTPFKEYLSATNTPELIYKPEKERNELVRLVSLKNATGNAKTAYKAKAMGLVNHQLKHGEAGAVTVVFGDLKKDFYKRLARGINQDGKGAAYIFASDDDLTNTPETRALLETRHLTYAPDKHTFWFITSKGYSGLDILNTNIAGVHVFDVKEAKDVKQILGRFRKLDKVEANVYGRWIAPEKDTKRVPWPQFKAAFDRKALAVMAELRALDGLQACARLHADLYLHEDCAKHVEADFSGPHLTNALRAWNQLEQSCSRNVFKTKLESMGIQCEIFDGETDQGDFEAAKEWQSLAKAERERLWAVAIGELQTEWANCLELVATTCKNPEHRNNAKAWKRKAETSGAGLSITPYAEWKQGRKPEALEAIAEATGRALWCTDFVEREKALEAIAEAETDYKWGKVKHALSTATIIQARPESLKPTDRLNRERYRAVHEWLKANTTFERATFFDAYKTAFGHAPKSMAVLSDFGQFTKRRARIAGEWERKATLYTCQGLYADQITCHVFSEHKVCSIEKTRPVPVQIPRATTEPRPLACWEDGGTAEPYTTATPF